MIVNPVYAFGKSLAAGVPLSIAAGYLGITGVAIGSVAFHGTLRWEWQLADELPMVSRRGKLH
jgi:dihydroceramidase